MKWSVNLLLFLTLSCPAIALAELPKQVELDYAVLSGNVIMPINDEYLVDLDARNNLTVGDILTLVVPGKKIYHPETKEILGSLDTPMGYLQVTRISSGYSYAKPLSADVAPQNGQQIRRFEQVPVLFVDNTGEDGQLGRQLMMDLPQFKWLQDADREQALLTFFLKDDILVVKTTEGNLLHSYSIKADQQLVAPPVQVSQGIGTQQKPEPKFLKKVADNVLKTLSLSDDNDSAPGEVGIIRQNSAGRRGVWLGPNLTGSPVGVAVADFDGDGFQETAIAFNNRLLISRVNQGEYTEVSEVEIPAGRKILSLDAVDLDQDGRPELCLTAVSGLYPASFIVKHTAEGHYATVIKNIKWYLRVVDLPGEAQVLIGQEIGRYKQAFEGKPFYLRLENNRLIKGQTVDLPELVNIYSFMPFTDNENRLFFAYLTDGDYLKVVSAEGGQLWESSEYFGGSETCFANREEHDGDTVTPTCIGPRLLKTPDNEILIVQNDGQRLLQRYRRFKESRVISMSWNGYSMFENWRTASQKGYLGDFALADADNDGSMELLMAVKFQHSGYIDKARSAIVIYELD